MIRKKIFITGGSGFLGRHLIKELSKDHKVYAPSSKKINLLNIKDLFKIKDKFDEIYHLAAWTQAGDFCLKYPADQWIKNQLINTNILNWWKQKNSKAKLIFIGTSCCYDENGNFLEENYLHDKPHSSLTTYAMTKKMLLQGAISMEKQYKMKWLCVVPSTLYGSSYHEDDRQQHFIFDLIRKILNGKYKNKKVKLWGNGLQKREIIHVNDFISNLIKVNKKINNEIINIGQGKNHSIKKFAITICKILNYDHKKVFYDKSKYVGALNKKINVNKIKKIIPTYQKNLTPLMIGLKETIKWYEKNFF